MQVWWSGKNLGWRIQQLEYNHQRLAHSICGTLQSHSKASPTKGSSYSRLATLLEMQLAHRWAFVRLWLNGFARPLPVVSCHLLDLSCLTKLGQLFLPTNKRAALTDNTSKTKLYCVSYCFLSAILSHILSIIWECNAGKWLSSLSCLSVRKLCFYTYWVMYSLSGSLNAKSYIPKEAGPQRTVGNILPNFWNIFLKKQSV